MLPRPEYPSPRRASDALHSLDGLSTDSTTTPRVGRVPSKVVCMWNLPGDVEDAEIVPIAAAFGTVCRTLLLRGKRQALIEMDSVAAAEAFVRYVASRPLHLRGYPVTLVFSTHDHIEVKPPEGEGSTSSESPSCVLHVLVTQVMFPVTVDALFEAFKPHGAVLRIITFVKTCQSMALVELDSVESASAARACVDNQFLFSGCNRLHVTFSKLTHLSVKYNNDKSRDFTKASVDPPYYGGASGPPPPYPPKAGGTPEGGMPYGGAGGYATGGAPPPLPPPYAVTAPPYPSAPYPPPFGSPAGSPVVIVSGFDAEKVSPYHLFILFGVYGDVLRVKKLFKKQDEALVQYRFPEQAVFARVHLNACTLFGSPIRVNASSAFSVTLHPDPLSQDFSTSRLHRYQGGRHVKHMCAPSAVLHVSNIPAAITHAQIQTLFEPHGTVEGVRSLESHAEGGAPSATQMMLVAMSCVDEATTVLVLLHNFRVEDRYLRISFSRSTF